VTGLPGAGDFNPFTSTRGAAVSGIGTFTVKGISGQTNLFIDADVAAWMMGTIAIKGVQVDNSAHGGADFGVSGHTLSSYKRDATSLSKLTGPQTVQHDTDFYVQLY
jgi:hypothetical protein